ncbi:single-stranded DNA-binding protein, mitochondrial [Prorops nasuta]|uniref:single-stranded DNA-binding protein, mitochondrial n=1 Tax=Prorops nasuta TaxID=863751 RepID=UPI0034CD8A37
MLRQVIFSIYKPISHVKNVRFCSVNMTDLQRMERTLNEVTLVGRVGKDPQMRGTNDHPVVLFSLATHINYKYTNGEVMQKTDWHRICVFKPTLRETAYTYIKSGARLLIKGTISYSEFKDDGGNVKNTTNIVANDIVFINAKGPTANE